MHYLSQLDFKKPFAIRLGEEPIQVDVFNAITGVDYQEASKNSILFEISEGLEVNFLGFNELVINKMLTGRLRDKADVDELQRIKKYEKDS
ncbi:MAG: hypothetical protein U5K31_06650 [Balneolaceae bacterium]|nr:hypothetical protein [Balneolaceae bacterium]